MNINIGCKSVFMFVCGYWAFGNVSISSGTRHLFSVNWTTFQFFASSANNYENIAIFDHHHDTDRLCRGNTNNPNDMWNVPSARNVRTPLGLMWLQILRSRQSRNTIFERLFHGTVCVRHRHAHEFGHRLRLSSLPECNQRELWYRFLLYLSRNFHIKILQFAFVLLQFFNFFHSICNRLNEMQQFENTFLHANGALYLQHWANKNLSFVVYYSTLSEFILVCQCIECEWVFTFIILCLF